MKRLILHPYLFPAYPIMAVYSQNVYYTKPSELVPVLAASTALAFVAWCIGCALLRDKAKAGLLASVAVVLFFTYAPVRDFLSSTIRFGGEPIVENWNRVLLPLEAFLVLLVLLLVWRSKRDFHRLTLPLNVVAICLVAVPIVVSISQLAWPEADDVPESAVALKSSGDDPDIYYIVLDAFGRPDVLRDRFDLDLSGFIQHLQEKGFYVAPKSATNYGMTFGSISSSLNMSYHHELVEAMGPASTDRKPYLDLIAESRVIRSLQEIGYTFVNFSSGWAATEAIRSDLYLTTSSFGDLTEFQQYILLRTPVVNILRKLTGDWEVGLRRKKILYTFETLPELPESDKPMFVLAHVMAPHHPFVFGANGEPVNPGALATIGADGRIDRETYVAGYAAQATFIAKKAQEAIDEILERSDKAPIIILQGDHGPDSADPLELLPILNAYHLPGDGAEQLYDTITPVNSFRVIFNHYFDADLELLPDENYAPAVRLDLYDLKDFTALMQGREPAVANPKK